jgi:putative hydrolase of the HAD superfamily
MKRYTTIVFDLGNTLIRFDHNISAEKISKLSRHDHEHIYQSFFDSPMTRAFECGEISSHEFWQRASHLLSIKIPYEKFVGIWNDIFWEDKGSCRIARKLKRSYKLFLLSNINRLHFNYIKKKFRVISIFDKLILSYMVGAMKPDRAIFEHVVKLAGGDRSKILYIDDRKDLIREARSLGIDSIRYEGAKALGSELKKKGIWCPK